uniref:VPS9 domain-containing protein n=1 Tax=Clastoptera arizonana TaxID=38151 RepID=A0A1B6CTE2_9HEMI
MESNYDEDLSSNTFFKLLQADYFELFQRATIDGWVICVPRLGSLPKYALSQDDFFSHVLVPSDELPETHFRSLNDKDVKICNRVITVESSENVISFSTHVLFEETFYTENMLKYKVLCIENPLQYYSESSKIESKVVAVQTLRDCIDLLWTESSGKEVLVEIDNVIALFLTKNKKIEYTQIDNQVDLTNNLYEQCLEIVLHNKKICERSYLNHHLIENLKISVESYVHHGIYKKLIKGITACTATEDSNLNKIIRNLSDLQLKDLDIRIDLYDTVPSARMELARIDGYSTVLGKIGCLKRTIAAISKQDCTSSQGNIIAADDLLPILIFLVIKSGVANWIAHLTYMKRFCFSTSSDFHVDQNSFLVTSLEAAIEHVNSGYLLYPAPDAQFTYEETNFIQTNPSFERQRGFKEKSFNYVSDSLKELFDYVSQGNIEKVIAIFTKPDSDEHNLFYELHNLCHPLCSCDKCEVKISTFRVNSIPTVHSCDSKGLTVLHIACMFGQPKIVDLLLSMGARVNAIDQSGATPLHIASSRGHQNELLLLLHNGAKLDISDNEGNTPLHCASNNGHDGCIKALLYFSEQNDFEFDINKKNNQGDTALHNAAHWGYSLIVKTLLEYGATPTVENKRKLTPINLAHNIYIAKMLTSIPWQKNLKLIIPKFRNDLPDFQVAAALKKGFDFIDDKKRYSLKSKMEEGDRPCNVDQIKKIDRLLIAISHGDIHLSCFYLGIKSSSLSKHNCHPLCECNEKKDKDEFGDSINLDALNVNVCNSDGFTPLHMAALHGRVEITEILLKNGASINIQTRKGLTPLHLACQNLHKKMVKILLEKSCDLDIQDCNGNTALHYACQSKSIRLVELLLKYNPKRNLRNSEGRTALDETEENMCLTIARLLTES